MRVWLLSLLLLGCGSPDPEAPASPFVECTDDCVDGGVCLEGVCVSPPGREARLGGEVFDEALDKSVALEQDTPPRLGCWRSPDEVAMSPELVRVRGEVDELAAPPPRKGLCITIYDREQLLDFWRHLSRCPGIEDIDERIACFGTNPCLCATLEGDAKIACEADLGPVLGTTTTTNPRGLYEVDAIPTNRPLVFRVSGNPELWRETYMWDVTLRADHAEENDQGEPEIRFHPIGVAQSDWMLVQTLLGRPRPLPAETGVVAGELRDCGDADRSPEPIIGATIGLVAEGEDTLFGFHNGDPEDIVGFTPDLLETRSLGIFGAVGIPEGPNRLVAAATVDGDVLVAAVADVYVPPSAAVVLYVAGRSRWREL